MRLNEVTGVKTWAERPRGNSGARLPSLSTRDRAVSSVATQHSL